MKGTVESHLSRLENEEIVARAFTTLGVLIWGFVAIAMLLIDAPEAFVGYAAISLLCAVALVVGLKWEWAAAALMGVAAVALAAAGVVLGWETGLWIIVSLSVGVELVAASAMFAMAGHEVRVVEREYATPVRGVHA